MIVVFVFLESRNTLRFQRFGQTKAKADDDNVNMFDSFWTAWLKAFGAL